MGRYVVETEELTKEYKNKVLAVNKVSLKVKKGEVFGLLGPNGAGKTTLVKMLTTVLNPTSGRAFVLGYDLLKERMQIREKIGYVQQNRSFEVYLSVKKNLDVYGMIWNLPACERKKRIDFLLDLFELEKVKDRTPEFISGGERKRLQVAREFMHDSELLFLDEPTAGLDPVIRRKILNFIKHEVRKKSITVFYTTHIMEEAEFFCDRIAFLNNGNLSVVEAVEIFAEKFGGSHSVILTFAGEIPSQDFFVNLGISCYLIENDKIGFLLKKLDVMPELLVDLRNRNYKIKKIRVESPSLEDAIINLIENGGDNEI